MRFLNRVLFVMLLSRALIYGGQTQFSAAYVPLGKADTARLLAADSAGNLFIVATVQEPSGRPQIRALKTDNHGNMIAQFDFGGSSVSLPDIPSGAAVDAGGNLVIVGTTSSPDFPLVSALISHTTAQAGFVVKLDGGLTNILFSTRIGGTQGGGPTGGGTSANAVAIDKNGNIYVAGSTAATDFPVTTGALQTTPPKGDASGSPVYAFVTEISATGDRVVYSTYFGADRTNCRGSCPGGVFGTTSATAIALDANEAISIAGNTTASQFPVTIPGTSVCSNGTQTGFVATFHLGGAALDWGECVEVAGAYANPLQSDISITTMAVDAAGNIAFGGTAPAGYICTNPDCLEFPGGNPPPTNAPYAGFVTILNRNRLVYSDYFGGNVPLPGTPNGVTGLALDAQGDIWITGGSALGAEVDDFPPPNPAIPLIGPTFVAEISPLGVPIDGVTALYGTTAPSGAAGAGIVITPTGGVAALGSSGSILLSTNNAPATFLGIQNSAGSFVSGQVAPLELVSLFGLGIGPENAMGAQVENGILTNSLGGVQVFFGSTAAPLLYAGPNQINAIVPSTVFGHDSVPLKIVTPNGALTGPSIAITPSQPDVFVTASTTNAAALNQDGTLNSADNPASSGSIVTVWATGAGMPLGAVIDGSIVGSTLLAPELPVSVLAAPSVTSNEFDSLEVLYAGDGPGLVTGAVQINFRLPAQIQAGANQILCELQVGSSTSEPFYVFVRP